MGSMNISIKQEAYDLLKMLKHENKSFSDVIIELVSEKGKGNSKDIVKLWGCLKENGSDYWSQRKKDYKKIREELDFEFMNRSKK